MFEGVGLRTFTPLLLRASLAAVFIYHGLEKVHPDNSYGFKRANVLILDRLQRDRPDDAVLSEEAVDDLLRVHADRVWIVDPVDGTREFSWPGRTDWAVHVALWQRNGGPDGGITDAAVALPARGEVYRTDTVTAPPPRSDSPSS